MPEGFGRLREQAGPDQAQGIILELAGHIFGIAGKNVAVFRNDRVDKLPCDGQAMLLIDGETAALGIQDLELTIQGLIAEILSSAEVLDGFAGKPPALFSIIPMMKLPSPALG
jgi:hypothetical protein